MSPPNNAIAGESKPLAARTTPAMNIALFTGRVSHASGRPSKEQLPPMSEVAALACETLPVNKAIFIAGVALAASGLLSPAIALLGGLIFGLTLAHPFHAQSRDITKFLLQGSVGALGFGMNLHEVLHAGQSGFVYTAVSISAALFLGLALGRLIQVAERQSFLITAGTAICGGSAIAAVGPIAGASERKWLSRWERFSS